jgi:hypothetical protein
MWVKCTTSAECKTDRSAVLTVKSGLDHHMIIKLKDECNHGSCGFSLRYLLS